MGQGEGVIVRRGWPSSSKSSGSHAGIAVRPGKCLADWTIWPVRVGVGVRVRVRVS